MINLNNIKITAFIKMRVDISRDNLENLYNNRKLTTYEIASIYDCCQTTIWKRLHQFGVKPRFPWNIVDVSKDKLEDLYLKRKLSTWQIEEKLKIPRSTIYRKICEYRVKTRSSSEAHIIYPRKNFSGNKTEKAYIIGFAMGDLRARKRGLNSETINVDCGSTKKAQIALIYKLFKPYGRVWISKPNKKGAVQIECFLNNSFGFLLKKRILADRWIINNKKYFCSFLAGFTDAEGCIAISNREQAYYSLGNYNKNLLKQIRQYLINNYIICPKLYESKTKGRKCFGKYFHNQNYWQMRISRKDSLLALFEFIGPYLKHSDKKTAVKTVIRNIILRNKKIK